MTAATQPPRGRPRITVLTLGGTIAALGAGGSATTRYALDPLRNPVLEQLASLETIAALTVESVAHLPSHDLPVAWVLGLARRIADLFAANAADGVVVTHGTDTLEESAFLLDLLLPPGRPVVLTGAMRPASATSADGPRNLDAAIRVAAAATARDRGVLVCLNDRIGAAATVTKAHTSALDAFQAPEAGFVGVVAGEAIRFFAPAAHHGVRFAPGDDDTLPRVEIMPGYLGVDAAGFESALERGAAGIVIAGTGNGSVPAMLKPALSRARAAGVPVVRASQVAAGDVTAIALDDDYGTLPAGRLNPRKARLLLMLALRQHATPETLAALFRRF